MIAAPRTLRSLVIGSICLISTLWFYIKIHNQSPYEKIYPRKHFCKDISKIYFDLGRISGKRKKWNSAIRLYNSALKHEPNLISTYLRLGQCYEHLKNKDMALKTYLKALTLYTKLTKKNVQQEKINLVSRLIQNRLKKLYSAPKNEVIDGF